MTKVVSLRGNVASSETTSETNEGNNVNRDPNKLFVLFENCYGEKTCEPTMYEVDPEFFNKLSRDPK